MINDRAVRPKEAAKILNISLAMLYKLLNTDPEFPKGSKLGRCRVFLLSDLQNYLEAKRGVTNAK